MADAVVIDCRFGRLVVFAEAPRRRRPSGQIARYWHCRCDCGREVQACTGQLRSGHTVSCGCARTDATVARSTKHGLAPRGRQTPEYFAWKAMHQRCRAAPGTKDYQWYGARGIAVSPEWSDFGTFFADMGQRPSPAHSIDRIDNDLGYSPSNCRWATASEQRRNQRPRTARAA